MPAQQRGRVHLVAIVGPTAVGKTDLALRLADHLDVEIVSADSRQIYRGMDIGTAKPTPDQLAAVPHHLIDVVNPNDELTLAHFQGLARQAVEGIWARGRLPLLVGGTGLYVRAFLEGWTVPPVPPDPALRQRLAREAEERGADTLHARLTEVDPESAARIDPRNVRRVIRALEIHEASHMAPSLLQRRHPPDLDVLQIGLTMPRPALYARVDARVDRMMAQGLEDEVRRLAAQGYSFDLPAMSGLGYRQIGQYLRGEVSRDEAVALIKRHTRRFIRQQYNWFRLGDRSIHWFEAEDPDLAGIVSLARAFRAGVEEGE